jgi:hypothetical protein
MPTFEFTSPEGKTYSVSGPDGSTKEQAFQMLQKQIGGQASKQDVPAEPFGQRLNREIADIPRQVGLTARHGIEGAGDTLDFLSSPIRVGLNALGADIQPGAGRYIADKIGLPKPQNSTERVVGDAARLMAGSMMPVAGAGKLAQGAQGTTKAVLESMASNPGSQLASAAAAGGAGGYTRETGGDAGSQFAASLAAGIAAPMALNKAQQVGTSAVNAVRNRINPAPVNAQIDITINNALQDSGLTMADLPTNIRNSIRTDVQQALRMDGALSPDAVRRLADYRLTGATPTAATLTLDPAMISQQKNLAKLSINSKDVAAQQLGQVENSNNRQLIAGLNDLGASRAPGQYNTGENLRDTLASYAGTKKGEITNLYNAAKDSQGRAAALDPQTFSTQANNLLDYNLKGAFVPEQIRTMMNDFASGKVPLNIHSAEQFKTIIGNAQRGASDGNVRAALGNIREALDNTPLLMDSAMPPAAVNGGSQLKTMGGVSTEMRPNLGHEAIDSFNAARGANRNFMQQVESNPALAAAMDNAAPDAFFQQHVLKADVRDLRSMLDVVGDNPAAAGAIKSEVLGYLKSKALSGATDEIGNFSQSAYNKAVQSLGDRKLSMLFSPDEIKQIKAIGRVASYEQVQPRGSAVNNSNTAGAAISSLLDRIGNSALLSKIPLGNYFSGPAQNISVGIQANQAMNVPRGLVRPQVPLGPQAPVGLLMSPAAFMQPEDERQPRGLLFP